MPSLFIRLLLCLSSYFPLTVIFAVQFFSKGRYVAAIVSLSAGIFGLVGLSIYLRLARRLSALAVHVDSVSRQDAEAMSYIVTYLLPFIALPSGSMADGICLGIFLAVIAVLYVHSDMLHINPM